jgi:Tol biopolymer transport system component
MGLKMKKCIPITLGFLLFITFIGYLKIRQNEQYSTIKNNLTGKIIFPVGKNELYILSLPSMELKSIHLNGYHFVFPSYPSWSPDGQKIAISQDKENVGVLTILDLANDRVEEFNEINLNCDYISWAPNEEYIAFLGRPIAAEKSNYRLYILATNSKKYTLVSNLDVGPYRPSWSPDSLKIAISSADNRIFILDASGKKKPDLIISSGCSPAWSPDGKFIVYRARYSSYLYDMQKKTEEKLISNFGFTDVHDFAWSPDSKSILFKKLTDGYSPLEVIMIEDKTRIHLKEFGNLRGFAWKDTEERIGVK